ncbi:MAG TPA: cupin domain-containing protein [Gemmatimonadaceae bacterium]
MSLEPKLVVIDIDEEAATLRPGGPSRIVGLANEDCLKLSVYEGEGSWHSHPAADELFLVLEGGLELDILDRETVVLGPRQLATVPAGVVHRPRSHARSIILCFKPRVSPTEYVLRDSAISLLARSVP